MVWFSKVSWIPHFESWNSKGVFSEPLSWHTWALCTTACLLHHIVFDPMLVFQATWKSLNHRTIMDNCWMHTFNSLSCGARMIGHDTLWRPGPSDPSEMKHRNRVYMDLIVSHCATLESSLLQ